MREPGCEREATLLDAVLAAGGRSGLPADDAAHLVSCPTCQALVDIVDPLIREGQVAVREARVPSASAMWWRMQLRARREHQLRAVRPIVAWQGIAVACATGLVAAGMGAVIPGVRSLVAGFVTHATDGAGVMALSPLGVVALAGGIVMLLLAPVAVFLSLRD